MADFLKRVQSLSAAADNPPTNTVSVRSSAHKTSSDQTTKFDQQTGTPIVSPMDTLEEVVATVAVHDSLQVFYGPVT